MLDFHDPGHEQSSMDSLLGLIAKARELARIMASKPCLELVTHVDADGICAAGILARSLSSLGIPYKIRFLESISADALSQLEEFPVFTDLGSGSIQQLSQHLDEFLVIDHHQIQAQHPNQLNPRCFGFDGELELSGAGTAFLVATQLKDLPGLACLAVVGSVGDLQDRLHSRLVGLNRMILGIARSRAEIACQTDLRFFGKQTRPLPKLLEYSSDPFLPGITGNWRGALSFLDSLGIPVKLGDRWRCWADLSLEEKRLLISKLVELCLRLGCSPQQLRRLVGESYILLREPRATELRDAAEFATLLNSTARYGEYRLGIALCLGERGELLARARQMLAQHRAQLVRALNLVAGRISKLKHLQYFHAGDAIRDTILGIVTGMSINTLCDPKLPLIGITRSKDGLKLSARASPELLSKGINLGAVLSELAAKYGGHGGGHEIAAGAKLPQDCLDQFLEELDSRLGQILAES